MNQQPKVTEHGITSAGRMYLWSEIRMILMTLDSEARKTLDKAEYHSEFSDADSLLEIWSTQLAK